MKAHWEILRRQERPLKFLASRVLMRLKISSLFSIRRDGVKLRFHPTSLSAQMWINPMERRADEAFFRSYLRRGDVVIDVGANVGSLTAVAARAVGHGQVYAIEPHPRIYGFLKNNLALNRFANVVTFNLALGDRVQQVKVSDSRSDDQNRIDAESGLSIEMRRLDDLGIREPHISLLKIDVEGYEKFVLQGATETLKRVSCIYFESSEQLYQRYDYSTRDVLLLLARANFSVYRMTNEGRIQAVTDDYSALRPENWIAVRSLEEFLRRSQPSRAL